MSNAIKSLMGILVTDSTKDAVGDEVQNLFKDSTAEIAEEATTKATQNGDSSNYAQTKNTLSYKTKKKPTQLQKRRTGKKYASPALHTAF
ncbi:hypothetical protein [uncultured Acetatifactor sp.]|uniref:hypothetical protein n=1 Tax=uncultured Acetatifactor sp. TaxID=1671927 RepID=UPI00262A517A|nr:hypothetical protein [uncultured Acetatifactor sp.]